MLKDFLVEFDHEMRQTRRLLERIPDDRLAFRPHERSTALGALARHVGHIPAWTSNLLGEESYEIAPDEAGRHEERPAPGSRAELLAAFDANVARARADIAAQSEESLRTKWSMTRNGERVLTLPRFAVLRQFLMNHVIHHRGQLTVYLRLLDVAVPALYGQSADEDW